MKKICFIILLISLSAGAETLTLDESIDLALNHSPAVKLQKNKKEQVEQDYRDVLGNALPNVSASYQVSNYLKKPFIMGFSLYSTFQRDLGIQVTQPIFTFGAVSNGIKAADAAIEMSELGIQLSQREIVYAVKVSFHNIELAKENLKISEESLKNAKTNLSLLKRYFAAGRPPQQDLIRLQADIASRNSLVREAKKNLRLAKSRLKLLLGIQQNTEITTVYSKNKTWPTFEYISLSSDMTQSQPEIKLFDKQIEYSEKLAKAQSGKIYPSVSAFYSFNVSERSDREWYDTDSTIDTSVVGLSLNWEIWSGGSNRAQIQKTRVLKAEAEIKKQQKKEELEMTLKEKIIEYDSLKQSLKNDEDSVKLARESFRVSQNRFKAGKAPLTELNGNEALLYQALVNRSLHIFQLNESLASIKKLTSKKGL